MDGVPGGVCRSGRAVTLSRTAAKFEPPVSEKSVNVRCRQLSPSSILLPEAETTSHSAPNPSFPSPVVSPGELSPANV